MDFEPLDLKRVFSNCISLVEWPCRLKDFPDFLPDEKRLLFVDIRIPNPISNERTMSISSSLDSSWNKRINMLLEEGMLDDLLLDDDQNGNGADDNDKK